MLVRKALIFEYRYIRSIRRIRLTDLSVTQILDVEDEFLG